MSDLSPLAMHGEVLVGALLIAALISLILQVRSQSRRLSAQAQRMEDLQGAVAAYGQSLIISRTLIEQVEARLSAFTDQNLEIQSQFAFNRSFEEASRLVKDGGTAESLVKDCGLSDAEAALMIRLHQREDEKPRQQWRQPTIETPSADEDPPLTSEEIRLQESLAAAKSSAAAV